MINLNKGERYLIITSDGSDEFFEVDSFPFQERFLKNKIVQAVPFSDESITIIDEAEYKQAKEEYKDDYQYFKFDDEYIKFEQTKYNAFDKDEILKAMED